MLTVDETAAEWRVTPATVREWAREGKLPSGVEVRWLGRLMRFDEQEVKNAGKVAAACPSTVIQNPLIGGYASRSAVERFAKRQEQKTASKPKNSSTSSAPGTGVRLSLVSSTTHGKRHESGG